MVVGGICFVPAGTFVMIHLGFVNDVNDHTPIRMKFLSRENLWLLNVVLGIGGGILLWYKHFFIAALSGLIASLAITGAALLYLSWRDSILNVEMIVPMLAGLVGIVLYKKLEPKQLD